MIKNKFNKFCMKNKIKIYIKMNIKWKLELKKQKIIFYKENKNYLIKQKN